MNVSDGSTDNYLLTGPQNGESYTISIVAASQHLPSERIATDLEIMLGEDIHVQVAVKQIPLFVPWLHNYDYKIQ